MRLDCAAEFSQPVDLASFPDYAAEIAHPMDLGTIKVGAGVRRTPHITQGQAAATQLLGKCGLYHLGDLWQRAGLQLGAECCQMRT